MTKHTHLKFMIKHKGTCYSAYITHLEFCPECPLHDMVKIRGCRKDLIYDLAVEMYLQDYGKESLLDLLL